MILVHRQPFGVAAFHARERPDMAGAALARGPVVRVRVRFERWLGGRELALAMGQPVRLMAQPPMAGFEDILLGRDFLVAHQLLVILDGQDETVSILHPADEDNRRRRDRVLDAISEHQGSG